MLSLTRDLKPIQDFQNAVNWGRTTVRDRLNMHIFEWNQGDPNGTEDGSIESVAQLEAREVRQVRVIFAPRDTPHPDTVNGLTRLFELFAIPSAFIAESLENVSQSFGTRTDENRAQYSWFHFLSRIIDISQEGGLPRFMHPSENAVDSNGGHQSQTHSTWTKAGFVLKSEQRTKPSSPQSQSTTSSSSSTTVADSHGTTYVTLICFGAPISLMHRFRRMQEQGCDEVIQDPYLLLEIVLDEMWSVIDKAGWTLSEVFGKIELRTLANATARSKAARDLDFPGLHNIAKDILYLRENTESALSTLESLIIHHKGFIKSDPSPCASSLQSALEYRKTLIQSTQRRLESLDERMKNIIQFSFNLVAQTDSRIMQRDGKSMKTVAIMTLVFMPLTTVATIFGTQLITLQDDAPYHIKVSPDFWLLWVISVPLTAIVMVVWRVCCADAREDEEGTRESRRHMDWHDSRLKLY
ncbi:hypothetical protein K469DRAFT_727878 [Zopfia rhizophila CBS 207.26]|uniref:Cora-domain-containing protein n=1 Tax=Zopfia rhizophila CBS 207.26 TaxID=1314779 RepID=A0A6A6E0G9_9PEZI|nr:hypothetical protein K469DRAFT_727878 [Zopfia rhizophila CBS 207.26]